MRAMTRTESVGHRPVQRLVGLAWIGLLLCAGCSGTKAEPQAGEQGATVEAQRAAVAQVSFARDIQPLLVRCVPCHQARMPGGGVQLQGYESVRRQAQAALATVRAGRMPPGGRPDPALAGELERWIAGGMSP